ncbi:MAG TPA: cob(I)yrinic acid a,c-diamide adenosyltransferase [Clostridiales bacterium]|nr:cob(I)yrinic acid a,c-diamide adenosyltransferase [Clostridiales bacterium]
MCGLIHIYTGDGKGKTTAAIGLGVRACGRGMKVLMVQFLKGIETGEMIVLKTLEPNFVLYRSRQLKKFTWEMSAEEQKGASKTQQDLLEYAKKAAFNENIDLLILDEIMAAINTGFLDKEIVLNFIKNKPHNLELVLTGRNAPKEFTEIADYVSEIIAVKHPMNEGISGRKGIEF